MFLYDVDDLSQIVSESLEGRAAEAAHAAAITEEEALGFHTWTQEQALTPAIVALRTRTRAVLEAEHARSLGCKLRHLPAADREALGVMLDAATNKLLHIPVTRLRAPAGDPRADDYVGGPRTHLFEMALSTMGPTLRRSPKARPTPERRAGTITTNLETGRRARLACRRWRSAGSAGAGTQRVARPC